MRERKKKREWARGEWPASLSLLSSLTLKTELGRCFCTSHAPRMPPPTTSARRRRALLAAATAVGGYAAWRYYRCAAWSEKEKARVPPQPRGECVAPLSPSDRPGGQPTRRSDPATPPAPHHP